MKKVPFHNAGEKAVHVGTVRVDPGQTREVDASLLPKPAAAPAPEAVAEPAAMDGLSPDALHALLKNSVAEITADIEALTDTDLVALVRLEEAADKPRSTLLAQLQEEQLRRAAAD